MARKYEGKNLCYVVLCQIMREKYDGKFCKKAYTYVILIVQANNFVFEIAALKPGET